MTSEENPPSQQKNTSCRREIILGLNWKIEDVNEINKCESSERKFRGFHLTKSKWDPYPWVGSVETGSDAEISGLRAGDCLLQIDGEDVLGLKMSDIALLIGKNYRLRLQVWRRQTSLKKTSEIHDKEVIINDEKDKKCIEILSLEGPLPEVALKLASAVSGVIRALECPVCLETAASSVSQCVNGHILCVSCRTKSTKCPVCRVSLGQGRCLLADKCHKILVESFGTSISNEQYSLRKRLFGSEKLSHTEKRNSEKYPSHHRAKNLISKIFPSIAFNKKIASTESLPATRFFNENITSIGRKQLLSRKSVKERLNLNDRTKSASTGELSRGKDNSVCGSLQRLNINNVVHCSNGLLSVPATPLWGGSTESMTNFSLNCLLWKKTGCSELLTPGTILDHLRVSHPGPIIHFNRGKAILPVPWPFPSDGIYILQQKTDLFFLQLENESICIVGTNVSGNKWSWTLNVRDNHGTKVTFHRNVTSIQESFSTSSLNIAILPKNISIHTIEIHLKEFRSDEGIEV